MSQSITEFIHQLNHPLESLILQTRELLLRAATFEENIKWNAPNFLWEGQDRITFHLPRDQHSVMLILHRGAKKQVTAENPKVKDPQGLLTWRGEDRASLTIRSEGQLQEQEQAITDILRDWIQAVEH